MGDLGTDHEPMLNGALDSTASLRTITSLPPKVNLDHGCGYRFFKPQCLQRCANSKILVASLFLFLFTQSFMVLGISSVNTSTLERRFDFHSAQIAWITIAHDVTAGITAFFLGYFGINWHKGRVSAVGAAIMSFGCFIMFLPHILSGPFHAASDTPQQTDTCRDTDGANITLSGDGATPGGHISPDSTNGSNVWMLFFFIIGNVLIGLGSTSCLTLGIPYVDDNCKHANLTLYTGIVLAAGGLGPAVGYIVGGLFLDIYVDAHKSAPPEGMTSSSPGWVGAWWAGYLCGMVLSFMVAVIMSCFPEHLPESRERVLEKFGISNGAVHMANGTTTSQPINYEVEKTKSTEGEVKLVDTKIRKVKEVKVKLLRRLKDVVTNAVWTLITIAVTIEASLVVAFGIFLPKVIQFQFSQTPGMAALLIGVTAMPAATLGLILGGVTAKVGNFGVLGLLRQCSITCLLSSMVGFAFLFRCPGAPVAGVHVSYDAVPTHSRGTFLESQCNQNCDCGPSNYEPVCGQNGLQYFSPCHAGCHVTLQDGVYSDCECVTQNTSLLSDSLGSTPQWLAQATPGVCAMDCGTLPATLAIVFIATVLTFMSNSAAYTITLRIVSRENRTLALGIQQALLRILGSPALPALMGYTFDRACVLWRVYDDGHRGACWLYDNASLAVGLTVITLVARAGSAVCYTLAWFAYKGPSGETHNTTTDTNREVVVHSTACSHPEETVTFIDHLTAV